MANRPLRILTHVPAGLLRRVGEEFPTVELIEIPQEGDLDDGVAGVGTKAQGRHDRTGVKFAKRSLLKSALTAEHGIE